MVVLLGLSGLSGLALAVEHDFNTSPRCGDTHNAAFLTWWAGAGPGAAAMGAAGAIGGAVNQSALKALRGEDTAELTDPGETESSDGGDTPDGGEGGEVGEE